MEEEAVSGDPAEKVDHDPGLAERIALADELRRARAAELPTLWLTSALVATFIVLFAGVLGAISTERDA